MAATAGIKKYAYGAELCLPTKAARDKVNEALTAALWRQTFKWRNRRIVWTIVYKGHLLEADMVTTYKALVHARHQLQQHTTLQPMFEGSWRMRIQSNEYHNSRLPGVVGRLEQARRLLNWTWISPFIFKSYFSSPMDGGNTICVHRFVWLLGASIQNSKGQRWNACWAGLRSLFEARQV